jgi:preprotein translocase subunit SecA
LVVGAGRARTVSQMGGGQRGVAGAPAGEIDWTSVGRNDACPCGSGKKFKKCHGANA